MALSVAVQMDPVQSIDIAGDSTFAMMLEAQARGHSLFTYHPDNLSLRDGSLFARGEDVTLRDEVGNHVTSGEMRTVDLGDMDVVRPLFRTTVGGDYVVTPSNLEGTDSLRFRGGR